MIGHTALPRQGVRPGRNIDNAAMDYEKPPVNLFHRAPVIPETTTIRCEGCGAELQVPVQPALYACPAPACRSMYWFPCQICHENKRRCKNGRAGTCAHDNGHYVEAVLITRRSKP